MQKCLHPHQSAGAFANDEDYHETTFSLQGRQGQIGQDLQKTGRQDPCGQSPRRTHARWIPLLKGD